MQRLVREKSLRHWARFLCLAWLPLAFACSSLDRGSDTHQSLYGGGGEGGGGNGVGGKEELPPEWACLEAPQMAVPRDPMRVNYVVPIFDFDSQTSMLKPVEGLKISVCGSSTCETPETDVVIANVPMQPEYVYLISLPWRYENATLRLTAPGYIPMDYVFGGPLVGPPEGGYTVTGLPIPLLREATLNTLYEELGFDEGPDFSRGVLAVRTLNCLRGGAPSAPNPTGAILASRAKDVGIRLVTEIEDPGTIWSLSFGNHAVRENRTDERGVVGYLNAPPGVMLVEAAMKIGDTEHRYGRNAFRVRAGVITLGELRDGVGRWGQ